MAISPIEVRYVALFPETFVHNQLSDYPSVTLFLHNASNIRSWCDENIGHKHWYKKHEIWYFTDSEKATLFILTWL